MEKISISFRIPALDINHDFIIPSTMGMRDVRKLVVDILASEYGIKKSADDIAFIDTKDGKVLRMDANFAQMGIGDGAKLLLL